MLLDSWNWLPALAEDVLQRGSLYPSSSKLPELNANTWLSIMGEDIVNRGSLYPGSEMIDIVTPNNFLVKLRDDILQRGSFYPDMAPSPYLSELSVSGVTLSPAFNPNVYEYTAGTTTTNEVTVFIDHDSAFTAICYFNNVRYTPGNIAILVEGLNSFRVELSNSDGESVIYAVTIAYTPPSTLINTLTLSSVELNPEFEPGITAYTGNTTGSNGDLYVSTESATAACSVKVNNTPITVSGVGPFTANIPFDDNVAIEITITNRTAPQTVYTIDVTKQ